MRGEIRSRSCQPFYFQRQDGDAIKRLAFKARLGILAWDALARGSRGAHRADQAARREEAAGAERPAAGTGPGSARLKLRDVFRLALVVMRLVRARKQRREHLLESRNEVVGFPRAFRQVFDLFVLDADLLP